MSPDRPPARAGFARGLLAGAALALLLLVAVAPLRDALLPDSDNRVEEALETIETSYFHDTDVSELEDASVEGMVRRLRRENDDRFSHYFDAETFRRFDAATEGQFSGVGMTVSQVKQGLRVARVFAGTPAEEAGLAEGDLIVAVEGSSIAGISATEASSQIKGPPGTEVELTVTGPEGGDRRRLTVERAEVRIPAVDAEILREDGHKIGYAALHTFSRGAHGELRSEIERLFRRGAEALILDLRSNGGGLLDEAILVASIFVEDGPIVTTEGRTRPRETFEASGEALPERPLVVLTNRDTASAAEIVAAALQQNELAEVIGTRTFGKGTFQEVVELDGGAALNLTVGEYLTADGSTIADKGVKPDIRVADDDPADGDDPLERAKRILVRGIG